MLRNNCGCPPLLCDVRPEPDATITGTVKEFELINPHSWLRVMVPNAKGVPSEMVAGVGRGLASWGTSAGLRMRSIPATRSRYNFIRCWTASYGGQLVSVTLPSGKVLGQRPRGIP